MWMCLWVCVVVVVCVIVCVIVVVCVGDVWVRLCVWFGFEIGCEFDANVMMEVG